MLFVFALIALLSPVRGSAVPTSKRLTYMCNLQSADLSDALLRSANLKAANLNRANLQRADLRDADLRRASLKGARFDDKTRWPDGFDPAK
jgi:hypothetical protein